MVFIFVIAIAVLSVSLGFLLNGAWSAVFTTGDVPDCPSTLEAPSNQESRRRPSNQSDSKESRSLRTDTEPPDNPRDLDDPEQRREFERRYPPTKRL
jgi:hypothetical protein